MTSYDVSSDFASGSLESQRTWTSWSLSLVNHVFFAILDFVILIVKWVFNLTRRGLCEWNWIEIEGQNAPITPADGHCVSGIAAPPAHVNVNNNNSLSPPAPDAILTSGGGAQDPTQAYKSMLRYIMKDSDLIENGYPRTNPNGIRGHVIAIPRKRERYPIDSDLRVCDRCSKGFQVDKFGFPVQQESCFYNPDRRFKKRNSDGAASGDGCTMANSHVIGGFGRNLFGFISAILGPGDEDTMGQNPWDIIGLDCEYIYTTQGFELARVTIVSFNSSQIIYDQYVKTTHPVLDYNTRFSGINEMDLANEETTIHHVHAVLLANIRPNTIIIGHSLECDLLALKLCHNYCIDTALVFPHKQGLPYKRALRTLSSEILGKTIQVSEFGHNSTEDARTALELVLWKIKNTK